ncbi:MAG: GIY-YIG nuclease family protein [Patescibacteria group bacterium]
MPHFVYILECADPTLYVGSTNDLEKRLRQHNLAKAGAHYTKIRRPVVLKYAEEVPTFEGGRAREAEIKRMTRKSKLKLIESKTTLVNSM